MALENHNANPTIIEPAASSDAGGTRPRLLAPSLDTSPSSNSFDSSRPQSRGSSITSPCESLPPATRNVEPYELTNIRPLTPPDLEPLPPDSTLSPNERPRHRGTSSTIVPSESTESSSHHNEAFWLALCGPILSRRRWLKHSLGVFTLVASLVGLLFIGVRTYKLAVISTENSTLDGCTDLIQAGFTTLEDSTPLCKTAMKNGPLSSPYHLGKRTLHSSLALASRWMRGLPRQTCGFPYLGCQSQKTNTIYRNMSVPAIAISTTIALGGLLLIAARRNARSREVFTSPARSDLQITRHEDGGPETINGQGIIEKYNLEHHADLGQLRKRIRASQDQDNLMKDTAPFQSTNSSATTLVNGYSEPQASIRNRSSGENHKGLIGLQMNGSTKAFFKPDTGEFFRLNHWKRQRSDESSSSSDSDNPVSIEREGFTQNGPGTSVLAKGKAVKDKWIEELQLEHENWRKKHPHATPQQVGDCFAGLLTSEPPTGKPQII